MSIKYWPKNERPRERARDYGIDALSNAELLAIIIGKGTRERSAVDLGRELLLMFKNLRGIGDAHIEDLKKIKGIKDAKALAIAAVFELSRRYQTSRRDRRWVLSSPEQVYDYYGPRISHLHHEEFHVAILDTRNTLIKDHLVSKGILDATVVHPREIFNEVLRHPCAGIILVHNHPGGDPEPSDEDIQLTRRMVEAGRIVGIEVLDHVVVGHGSFTSLRAQYRNLFQMK